VGDVFAHDVPLMHAMRCKGVGWLIKGRKVDVRGRGFSSKRNKGDD